MARQRLDDFLFQRGIITETHLKAAAAFLAEHGGRFEAAVIAQGGITEEQLASAIGRALNLPVELRPPAVVDESALALLKDQFCETRQVFPLALKTPNTGGRRTLVLAVTDPLDQATVEEAEFASKCRIQMVVTTTLNIRTAILRHYRHQRPDLRNEGGQMTLIRPGGGEEVVETGHGADNAAIVDDDDVVSLTEEVTSRTALVDLIQERAERKTAAETSRDLSYLTGEGDSQRLDELERKLWIVLRILAAKGVLTQEEFLAELDKG